MMIGRFRILLADRSGATMVEYGLMAAFVAISALVALMASGATLTVIFDAIAGNLQAASASRQ